ncbi:transposase [Nostoc sp.]|uniref:transposase n=1 Tax=Nostoc sp. TaxID=1180 RepID=UPI003FA5BD3B
MPSSLSHLAPQLWPGAVVIMDNCSIHKSDELEALIVAAGASLIYLPPYSPDFSPIENCWSKIKNILRRIGARTYPDLLSCLDAAFAEMTIENLRLLVYSLLLLYLRRLITAIQYPAFCD